VALDRNCRSKTCRPTLRFIPAVERCEDRIAPALTFNFTFNDPNNLFAALPLLTSNLQAAGAIWGRFMDSMAPLDVSVAADLTITGANAASVTNVPVGMQNGLTIVEDGALFKARTGIDPNGNMPDIQVNINPNYTLANDWLDPSGIARTGPVPSDREDFISVLIHELGHGLGFTSFRKIDNPNYGTFPGNTQNTYDALTAFGVGGDPDTLYFTGAMAQAVFGGPVPLTSVGPDSNFTSQNFSHLGNPAPRTTLRADVMNGLIIQAGIRYSVSRLDVAILSDLGFPTLPNPVFEPTDPRLLATPANISILAVGADAGGGPLVNVYNAQTNALLASFFAFTPTFTGGVRVAVGDVNNDGNPDIICGAGPGGGPQVQVFDGVTFQPIMNFFSLPSSFTGGVWVASGDVDGDGFADIITSADRGGGPQVTINSGRDGALLSSFYATTPTFTGGVRVAAGDINGDGFADVIAGAGPGGGPQVTLFDGRTLSVLSAFYALPPTFTGGTFVAAGDLNGDGIAEIIAGAAPGGGPQVSVFNGRTSAIIDAFFAYPPTFTGGVRVGAAITTAADRTSILTAAGPGGGPQVSIFDGVTFQAVTSFFGIQPPSFTGGIFIGGYTGQLINAGAMGL